MPAGLSPGLSAPFCKPPVHAYVRSPAACLCVSPRFTLSLSGTHTLRSLLRSLRHVLPSEGVAVSVSHYCFARGKAHTGPGSSPTRTPYAALQEKTSPPPLRRLSIRLVAQTDGSFGQASLQGSETSGNVLNRSLRCFLPCAAIDPKAGAHRLVNSPDTKTCLCCPPGCACPPGDTVATDRYSDALRGEHIPERTEE